jgi:hypothetical protein
MRPDQIFISSMNRASAGSGSRGDTARDGGGQKLNKAPYQRLAAAHLAPSRSGVGERASTTNRSVARRLPRARSHSFSHAPASGATRVPPASTRAIARAGGWRGYSNADVTARRR